MTVRLTQMARNGTVCHAGNSRIAARLRPANAAQAMSGATGRSRRNPPRGTGPAPAARSRGPPGAAPARGAGGGGQGPASARSSPDLRRSAASRPGNTPPGGIIQQSTQACPGARSRSTARLRCAPGTGPAAGERVQGHGARDARGRARGHPGRGVQPHRRGRRGRPVAVLPRPGQHRVLPAEPGAPGPEITSWSGRDRSWCCAARRGYGRGASSPGSSAVGEPGEWTGCRSETKGADTRMEIRRKRADTRPGPRDWFTGQVWVADEDDTGTAAVHELDDARQRGGHQRQPAGQVLVQLRRDCARRRPGCRRAVPARPTRRPRRTRTPAAAGDRASAPAPPPARWPSSRSSQGWSAAATGPTTSQRPVRRSRDRGQHRDQTARAAHVTDVHRAGRRLAGGRGREVAAGRAGSAPPAGAGPAAAGRGRRPPR